MKITQYSIRVDGKNFKDRFVQEQLRQEVAKLYEKAKQEHPNAHISDSGFLACHDEDYWEIHVNACETGIEPGKEEK